MRSDRQCWNIRKFAYGKPVAFSVILIADEANDPAWREFSCDLMKLSKSEILVADSRPIVVEGLFKVVDLEPNMRIAGAVHTISELYDWLDRSPIDVLVLDPDFGKSDGLHLLKSLKARHPYIAILVFSDYDELEYAPRAIKAGALAYVSKSEPVEMLIAGLHSALKGELFVKKECRELLDIAKISHDSDDESLTDREFSIFSLIGRGFSTKMIAERLHLSVKTVEKHRENIKRKLHIDTAPKLVSEASRSLLIHPDRNDRLLQVR